MIGKYETHPIADTYPPMSEPELDALTADITERGLQRPVVRYQGKILDGRNRILACERAGVEPAFVDYEGDDPEGQARSLNLNRNLTSSQRALVAARQLPSFQAEARKRQEAGRKEGGKEGGRGRKKKNHLGSKVPEPIRARTQAADHFGVGERQVRQAVDLLDEAPDLASEVATGILLLAPAYEKLEARRKEAARKAADQALITKYQEAVREGEMTFEQALEKVLAEEREEKEREAAEADTRREWLKGFAALVDWVERRVTPRTDEHFTWYVAPDSPGFFDHGVTAEKFAAVLGQLQRINRLIFGGGNGQTEKE